MMHLLRLSPNIQRGKKLSSKCGIFLYLLYSFLNDSTTFCFLASMRKSFVLT